MKGKEIDNNLKDMSKVMHLSKYLIKNKLKNMSSPNFLNLFKTLLMAKMCVYLLMDKLAPVKHTLYLGLNNREGLRNKSTKKEELPLEVLSMFLKKSNFIRDFN